MSTGGFNRTIYSGMWLHLWSSISAFEQENKVELSGVMHSVYIVNGVSKKDK